MKKILIIDDVSAIGDLAKIALERRGCIVTLATTLAGARAAVMVDTYDVVALDGCVNSMDYDTGEILALILERKPGAVVTTTSSYPDIRAAMQKAGCTHACTDKRGLVSHILLLIE